MTDVIDQTRDTVTGALDAVAAAAGVPSWVIPATLAAVTVAALTGYRTIRAARAARNIAASSTSSTGSTGRAEGRARAERADRVLQRVETVGTVVAALLATAVSASGMWRFFADVLGVTGPARVLMFAFLEVALFVAGVRARRHIREVIALMRARHDGTYAGPIPSGRSVHQVLVWVIVVLTGVMSAADTPHWSGKLLRLAAPAVAAILWEIGAVAELQAARIRYGITPDPLAWRYSLRRLLVLARLADPSPGDGDTTDALARVDRGRRLTALVRARYRLEATSARAPRALATWRAWRVRRLTIAAVEHAALGTDPAAVAHVQYGLALLYTVHTGTAPAAVTHLDPWRTHRPEVSGGGASTAGVSGQSGFDVVVVPDGIYPAVPGSSVVVHRSSTAASTGTGASTAASTGTGASTAASTGTGASTAASTGTGASTAASTGTGADTAASTGTGADTAASTGTGASTAASTGTGADTAASTGTGADTAASTGTDAGADPDTGDGPVSGRSVESILAVLDAVTSEDALPSIRGLMREYGIGQARASRIRRAAVARLRCTALDGVPTAEFEARPRPSDPEMAPERAPAPVRGPLGRPVAPGSGAGQVARFEVVGQRRSGHRP